jgi:hypothetical protein
MVASGIAVLPSNFSVSTPLSVTRTISRSAGFASSAILVCKFGDDLIKTLIMPICATL